MSIFAELAEHASLPFEQGRMLPLGAYCDPAVLAAEHRALFADEWICVGRTADIPARGDYLTAEVPLARDTTAGDTTGHRSVIVLRGDDGEVGAFDNVCIHRGAQLLEGCGTTARITCPYHAWAFRLDGGLIGGPYMQRTEGFTPGEHRLVSLSVEVWEGFVFISQAADPAPLAPRLTGLTEVLAPYRLAGYVPVHQQVDVWATNWKLLVENFMDAYHVFKVHQGTFAANGDNTLDTTLHPGTEAWAHHVVVHDKGDDIAHPDNATLQGPWRKAIVLGAVFPTHVMQVQPDWLWYLQISPLGTDRCQIRWDVSVAPEMLAAQTDPDAYVAELLALLNAVNAEDQPIVEGVRRNVERPQFPRGPLSYLERNVHDFDAYVARRLTSG